MPLLVSSCAAMSRSLLPPIWDLSVGVSTLPLQLAPWTENKLHYRFESERFNKAKEKLQDERETSLLLKLSLKEGQNSRKTSKSGKTREN